MHVVEFARYLKRVGRTIKAARLRRGLKQIEVHIASGVTYRHYQEIEAGRVNVTLETLHRLAKVYRVKVEDLLKES